MAPDHVDITFPDGSVQRCATPKSAIKQMIQANAPSSAPINENGAEI